jgi:CheY-specific phosphatase CheX
MNEQRIKDLTRIVMSSLESLAFMFSLSDPQRQPIDFKDAVTGIVSFSGAFSGQLAVVVAPSVLSELAANMLGTDADEVGAAEQHDALKETVNIICGNWLPCEAGAEAVFNIGEPRILTPSEAASILNVKIPTVLTQMSVEDEPCDVYFFRDAPLS